MITYKFDLNRQEEYYKTFMKQVSEREIWQELKYYILPFMPEKFRGRVIFLPESCEPLKIYAKQKHRLTELESEWNNEQKDFESKLIRHFPKLNSIDILISPSFYGSVGWYGFWPNNLILVRPRYDRKIIDIQKLVVNALTHYFYISNEINLDKKTWLKKQIRAKEIQSQIFTSNKSKNIDLILDTQMAGKLAEKSIAYLTKLGVFKSKNVKVIKSLTKTQEAMFKLLSNRRYKLTSFDAIAEAIWGNNYHDKYSEYAITKHVQELKKKITKNSIHSQRGYGYILI